MQQIHSKNDLDIELRKIEKRCNELGWRSEGIRISILIEELFHHMQRQGRERVTQQLQRAGLSENISEGVQVTYHPAYGTSNAQTTTAIRLNTHKHQVLVLVLSGRSKVPRWVSVDNVDLVKTE